MRDAGLTDAAMTLLWWGDRAATRPYADAQGRVRWLWVKWRGVPMPMRWYLWVMYGVKPGLLPLCGCLDGLKTFAEALSVLVRRTSRDPSGSRV